MCLIHPCFQLELCFLTKQTSRRRFGKISIGLHWLQICTVTPANRSASLTVTLFTPFFSRFTTIHAIHLISTRLPIRPSDQPLNQPTRQKYLAFLTYLGITASPLYNLAVPFINQHHANTCAEGIVAPPVNPITPPNNN